MKATFRNLLVSALCALAWLGAQAGTATYSFDTNPENDPAFVIGSNISWTDPVTFDLLEFYEDRDANGSGEGGNPGGYLAITRSSNSQYSQVLFPDFDSGLIVKAFTFECDLRLGNATGNTGRPADGFSINYARVGDPAVDFLIANPGTADSSNYAVSGATEAGTRTGIAICFDTWSSNALPDGADIEGIIVRVDNVTVFRFGMPTRNGACDDITSLQTGPYDLDGDAAGLGGSPDGLCWAPLRVELAESGELTVQYKNTTLLNAFQTGYAPSAGRLLVAGRTGGANENNHIDNLTITTVPADKMLIGNVQPNAFGFDISISDSGASVLDPTTLVVTYDGNVITPTSVNKPAGGSVTTINYTDPGTLLAAGSAHTLDVTAEDTNNSVVSRSQSYTIPAYTLIPGAWKLAATPTTAGMTAQTHFIDETFIVSGFTGRYGDPGGDQNRVSSAEQQLAGGYVDNETFAPYDNNVFETGFQNITVVNWDENAADVGGENFNSTLPAAGPVANETIPGLGFAGAYDNVVTEVIAYVQLSQGIHRMGVNSDDGFKVTVAPGQPSVTGLTLGEFNAGRGASDTIFEFVVEEAGFYALRLLWFEGEGGANCEWFSVDRATGVKTLINGTEATSVKAFRNGAGRAVLRKALPANGWLGGRQARGIRAELVDGTTTVVDGSVKLFVGGRDVTAQATIVNGATTTVTYDPANIPDWGWPDPNWSLEWTESTATPTVWVHNFTFRLAPDDLRYSGVFNIEAEDWNHTSGQTEAVASTMPYLGGAYDSLAGVLNVDYFDDQNENDAGINYVYRTDQRPNHANATAQLGNRFGTDRPGASLATDMVTNFRLGWVGNFWGNYTRNIPAGVYKAYALLSIDNSNNDATQADLDLVTGATTTSQTLARLGTFVGRGNGGWGRSELAPLRDSSGREAVFNVESGATTLRISARSGDIDGIILVPSASAARLRSGPPTGVAPFSIPQTLTWVLDDFSTTIVPTSATLTIDGTPVPAAAFTATKTGTVTTATYVTDIGVEHDYVFSVNDSAGATIMTSGTFIGNFMTPSPAGMFLVEGEDFNTGGGQVQAAANTMPYLGNAYNGLGATAGVDYNRSFDEPSGAVYRTGEVPNVPFSTDGDTVRARDAAGVATWTMTANYRLGWAGGDPETSNWYNYTRNVAAGNYTVWASISHGDGVTSGTRMRGTLNIVTSDPTQPSQTYSNVGYFRAPSSGGWGANRLVPLRLSDTDISGDAATVALGGSSPTTFNYIMANGDYDYFMLVPSTGAALPNITDITLNANGSITITWTGGGVLEAATAITGPWSDVTGASSPYTFTPTVGVNALFGRIRAPAP